MLRPETQKLWDHLSVSPTLEGFVLIGGTALTLRIGHRLSDDLDFAFTGNTGNGHLPYAAIGALVLKAADCGFEIRRNDDPSALEEFEIAGMELHQWQQDFLVNGLVKLTFFVPPPPLRQVLGANAQSQVRIATLDELFKTKALITASRSKSRDWFDLFVLLKHHGYSMEEYFSAFREAGVLAQADTGLTRLCAGRPQLSDEGFDHLLDHAPTLEEMTEFFRHQRDTFEVREAQRQALQHRTGI